MFLLMRGMIKSDLTATLIRLVGKLGMPLGETLKLVLVTTLTLLVGEPRQIGHVAAMLAVTRGAGDIIELKRGAPQPCQPRFRRG